MSALDHLRQDDSDGHYPTICYNEALDDVAEALRNPTDEQVDKAVRATGMSRRELRRAWAAAAGDER